MTIKQIKIKDETFTVDSNVPSWPEFWERVEDGSWEPEIFALMDRYLTPEWRWVDIGAWIGPTALWAAHRGAQVVCVEPDTTAFDCLEHNLAANLPREQWTTSEGALTRLPGWYRLAAHRGFGSSMSFLDPRGERQVRGWSIAEVFDALHLENVSLVKIDCEGSEYGIFSGASDASLACFDQVAIEYHFGYERLVKRLMAAGFRVSYTEPKATRNAETNGVRIVYGDIYARR